MTFIRAKQIPPHSGNWYDYEVMSVRKGNKIIQVHLRYLGRSGRHSYLMSNNKILISKPRESTITNTEVNEPRITKMKTPARQIASARQRLLVQGDTGKVALL